MHHLFGFLVPMAWAALFAGGMLLRHRRKMAELYWRAQASQPQPPSRDDAYTRELEERVRVLERIVTEERHSRSLASEIEALRDPPAASPSASPTPTRDHTLA